MKEAGQIVSMENGAGALMVREDGSAVWVAREDGTRFAFGRVGLQEDGPIENGLCWHRIDRLIGEQYACRFHGQAVGPDRVRWQVLDEDGVARGAFSAHYALNPEGLDVILDEVDESLPSLCFPTPVASASLVLPCGTGEWLREPLPNFCRRIHRFYGHDLRMRWFGGIVDEATGRGWVAIMHRGHADAGVMHAGCATAPVWLKSLGQWRGQRIVRYVFTRDGYVGMAAAFRQWAMDNGLFVSLADKTETRPHLANLIGGRKISILLSKPHYRATYENQWQPVPDWAASEPDGPYVATTFNQAREILEDAHKAGWYRGLAQLPGWSHGGWDDQFPDAWPPEPALGSVADFEALVRMPDPVVPGLLDNYADIYRQSPSYPHGILLRADGTRLRGGIWSGGQCQLLDYGQVMNKMKQNVAHYLAHGVRAVYLDTNNAVQLYENHDPDHRMTRAEDEAHRTAMLGYLAHQGLITGSEVGCDFGVPVVDWAPNPSRHTTGVSVPLWALVFHDAHLGFSAALGLDPHDARPPQPDDMSRFQRGMLALLVNGLHLTHIRVTAVNWSRIRPMVGACSEFDAWMQRIGGEAMVDHAFLDDDRTVERSTYASGAHVTVNFGERNWQGEDGVLAPGAYTLAPSS